MLNYWRWFTSVEKKQNERVEYKHEEKGIEDSQSPFYAIIDDVEDSVEKCNEMDDKKLHHEAFFILRKLTGSKVHEFKEWRVIIIMPVDLGLGLGTVSCDLVHVNILILDIREDEIYFYSHTFWSLFYLSYMFYFTTSFDL